MQKSAIDTTKTQIIDKNRTQKIISFIKNLVKQNKVYTFAM